MAKVIIKYSVSNMGFPVAQTVQKLPAVQETWVRSPGWEDALEKEIANHSCTLAWRIPWIEKRDRLQSMESQKVGHDCMTFTFTQTQSGLLLAMHKCPNIIQLTTRKN